MKYKGICPECRDIEWHDYEAGDSVRCPKCETHVVLDPHPDLDP